MQDNVDSWGLELRQEQKGQSAVQSLLVFHEKKKRNKLAISRSSHPARLLAKELMSSTS